MPIRVTCPHGHTEIRSEYPTEYKAVTSVKAECGYCRVEDDGFKRGRREGLEGVIYYLASNGNPIWKKAAVAAVRNFMEKPDE
ncbi:hypothetical protein LCGC14_2240940 [marine sediment metagenome]|uniref:Uncharacterized protein n=1 Tax=marine sediment metagenome TaxID=412755 RepID=A0A0F9G0H4_9ZZZZ